MADTEVRYNKKTVTTVRGLEARSIAKWDKEGWELVSQAPATLMRTTLDFRRPKKFISRRVWVAGIAGVALVLLGIGLAFAAVQAARGDRSQVASPPSPIVSVAPSVAPTPSAAPTAAAVTDAETLDVFNSFFAERASNGVLWGKAVSNVTIENRVVLITFDPAAAGIDQATFDGLAADFDFPRFAATPIAFNDQAGNRLRPGIDSVQTLRVDGTLLGEIDATGILALNGLSH
jgi:hypothetical protein